MSTLLLTPELQAALTRVEQFALQTHCWYLDDDLAANLSLFVKDKNVIDLGGGDGSLALVMATTMQAKMVMVVEKEQSIRPHVEALQHRKLAWYLGYMKQFCQHHYWFNYAWDVAVLAYPPSSPAAFGTTAIPILDRCEYVAVLAQNNGKDSACGPRQLWKYLTQRKLHCYIQHPRNDLLVYSRQLRSTDQPFVEHEKHALTN